MVTRISTTAAPFSAFLDAALDSQGNIIVVASSAGGTSGVVARFLTNGTLDPGFGTNGIATLPFSLASDELAVAIQSNGQIVVGGSTYVSSVGAFALSRYNTDGTLDQNFGSAGQAITSFPGLNATLQVMLVQPDGAILASGETFTLATPVSAGAGLARYTADGSPDPTFGIGGTVTLATVNPATALALLSTGRTVFTSNSLGLLLNANGSVSATLPGIVAVAQTGSMDFQSNGKLISAFQEQTQLHGETEAVSAVRTNPNGLPDTSFTAPLFYFNTGIQFQEFNQSTPEAVLVTPSGQILVGGSSSTNMTGPVFGLARLNANGSLDSTFGIGGVVTTSLLNDDTVQKILVQSDGKIVAVGSAGSAVALVRYLGH